MWWFMSQTWAWNADDNKQQKVRSEDNIWMEETKIKINLTNKKNKNIQSPKWILLSYFLHKLYWVEGWRAACQPRLVHQAHL